MDELPKGIENILPYLQSKLELDPSHIQITQFRGGYSNLTFLIRTPDQELVLRRPPLGMKISKAHDMLREFSILQGLQHAGYTKIPKPILSEADESILGAPFFIMEKVEGLILRNKLPDKFDLNENYFHDLSANALDGLVELHQLELETSGLSNLGKPEGFTERQVVGWSERYFKAKTDENPEMEKASAWLLKNIPADNHVAFIHNDYKYDNLVLSGSQNPTIKAVLDWEMATVGNPLMDFGTSLAYWAEKEDSDILKMFNLTHVPGNFTRKEAVAYYSSKSELNLDTMPFYYAFGLFKVGVIAQQIYKRHKLGFAPDQRFAGLIHAVKACGKKAYTSIVNETI